MDISQGPAPAAAQTLSNRAIIWKWCKVWGKKGMKFYLKAFVTVAFMMFILEEGSQLLGFSRFTLIGGKLWEEAEQAIERDEAINKFNRRLCQACMFVNPISGYVFIRYFDQELVKIERENARVTRELKKGTPSGGITSAVATSATSTTWPQMVRITEYGECFHRETCSLIEGKTTHTFTREKAVIYGLRPCKKCKP